MGGMSVRDSAHLENDTHAAGNRTRQHAPNVKQRALINPSILAADFSQLGDQVRAVDNADWIHVDIMDGHFVPNLSFGPDITATVDKITEQQLDVHLMIENPEDWVDAYVAAGADCIIFHVEATEDHIGLAKKIRERCACRIFLETWDTD